MVNLGKGTHCHIAFKPRVQQNEARNYTFTWGTTTSECKISVLMTWTILPHALGNKLIIIIDKYVILSANGSSSFTFQLKI